MPKWIHDRAMSLKKDMEKTYGPEKAEQVAFAVATQQSHRLGKSPKKYGTPEGKAVARAKFDKPKKEYKKMAADSSRDIRMLSPEATARTSEKIQKVAPVALGTLGAAGGGMMGAGIGQLAGGGRKPVTAVGALIGAGLGAYGGKRQWDKAKGGRNLTKGDVRQTQAAIRAARRQGYNPILVDSRREAEFGRVRDILKEEAKYRKEQRKLRKQGFDMSAYGQLKIASFADEFAEIIKESKVQAVVVGGRTKRPFADKVKNFIQSGRKKGFIFLKPEHRATKGPKEVFG